MAEKMIVVNRRLHQLLGKAPYRPFSGLNFARHFGQRTSDELTHRTSAGGIP